MKDFNGKLVYVAGSYRHKDMYMVFKNISKAWYKAMEVVKLGCYPIVPHKCTEGMEGLNTPEFFIEGTKEAMRRCDAVLVLSDSENSTGTQGEIKEAERLGIPVFYCTYDLELWLTQQ